MATMELWRNLYWKPTPHSVLMFMVFCAFAFCPRGSLLGLGCVCMIDGPLTNESLGFLFFTLSLVTCLASEFTAAVVATFC